MCVCLCVEDWEGGFDSRTLILLVVCSAASKNEFCVCAVWLAAASTTICPCGDVRQQHDALAAGGWVVLVCVCVLHLYLLLRSCSSKTRGLMCVCAPGAASLQVSLLLDGQQACQLDPKHVTVLRP